jgi:hypothetical protein
MPRFLLASMILLAGAAWLQPAQAQPSAAGAVRIAQADPDVVDIVFSEIERRIILDYYYRNYRQWTEAHGKGKGQKHKDLPPGLARRDTLPPGLAKQLVRNGTLPPGLAKRSLPYDLVVRLPARPDWQEVVIVDDKVMLIRRATNLILDILLVAAAEAAD